ncbi:hypothetical protein HYH03_010439 [Edaphochlamys debaryana]|uniref:PDZ domain-containing protein n=1 Tax=Edaphochlamys debaryana TaxID=47281 RepID=A0A836BW10_9CHLO|nr:hypothetical protein HYH03_010439 [Edaphochlamys debaryana]|eukprot:KAG2491231.1 hypothetical protein HYH03_010439 [Edaphochlamys debaryana]
MAAIQARSLASVSAIASRRQLAAPARRRGALVRSAEASAPAAASTPAPAGLVRVTLRKPIGVVFEQSPSGGPVFVAEVTEGGAAAKSGRVVVGDVLSRCSAVVLKAGKEKQYENEGYGQRPYDNWEVIDFDCEGQDFKTCMSALRSNNERWGIRDITLVLRKP